MTVSPHHKAVHIKKYFVLPHSGALRTNVDQFLEKWELSFSDVFLLIIFSSLCLVSVAALKPSRPLLCVRAPLRPWESSAAASRRADCRTAPVPPPYAPAAAVNPGPYSCRSSWCRPTAPWPPCDAGRPPTSPDTPRPPAPPEAPERTSPSRRGAAWPWSPVETGHSATNWTNAGDGTLETEEEEAVPQMTFDPGASLTCTG